MCSKDGYYAKRREIFNRQTRETRIVYTPVIVVNYREFMVSNGKEIVELDTREEAEGRAKEAYLKHKEKVKKQLEEDEQ